MERVNRLQGSPVFSENRSSLLLWLTLVGSVFLVCGLYSAGQASLLRLAIPLTATATGFVLYFHRPVAYIQFTLWTWFITPLVRRVVDWHFGFLDQNYVLLTPLLVSLIAGLTLWRDRHLGTGRLMRPFLLCLAGIGYGLMVGLIRFVFHAADAATLPEVLLGFLDWTTPILVALHLYLHWAEYEAYRDGFNKTFVCAVLLLGGYGVYQYIVAPPWDRVWLEGLPGGWQSLSFGHPFPFEIRVWSTLNAPGPFSNVMLAGLLLLIGSKTRFKLLFSAAGYTSFLLSIVRTAWLAWLIGIVILLCAYRGAALRRALTGLFLLPICLLPLLFSPQMSDSVKQRLNSLSSVQKDESFQDRTKMYQTLTPILLDNPAGLGVRPGFVVKGFALDSAFLQIVFMLGFLGSILYAVGILFAVRAFFARQQRGQLRAFGSHELAYRAIFLATLAQLVAGNIFPGVAGLVLWTSLGLWMGALAQAENRTVADGIVNQQAGMLSPFSREVRNFRSSRC